MLSRVVMTSMASPLAGSFPPAATGYSRFAVMAAPVSASPRIWLAGNPGPPPSPASVALTLAVLALAFAAVAAGAAPRRHREAPLRKEMQARPVVTFRARVDVKANVLGMRLSAQGPLHLIVRGDQVEVTHPFPPARFLFGQQYCYRAEAATIEVIPGLWHDWIEIGGQTAGAAAGSGSGSGQ